MVKKLISLALALVMCLSLCVPAFATTSDNSGGAVFSSVPSESDLRLVDHSQEDEQVVAWIVDPEGKKTYVNPIENMHPNTRSFINGQVLWTFVRYDQSVTKSNDYQHFVGSVSFRNRSTEAVPMNYRQTETHTNTWTVSGKVEAKAQFKVAMLTELRAKFGASVTNRKTTASSNQVEFTFSVPAGKKGIISKFYAGKYSGGQGVWHGENVISGADAGYYYELGSAWGIATNEVNYDWYVE